MNSFASRWKGHHKELRNGSHKCAGLKRAFAKYGWDNLKCEILEEVSLVMTEQYVLAREQYWWDVHKNQGINLYNGRPTATGSVYHTNETKEKLRRIMLEKYPVKFKKCLYCGEDFPLKRKGQKYCNSSCFGYRQVKVMPDDYETLYSDYIVNDLSIADLMNKYNCKQRAVYYALAKFKLKKK